MRVLSRHLPPVPSARMTMMGAGFLILFFAGLISFFYLHAEIFGVVAVVIALASVAQNYRAKTRFENMMASRVGENICTFRRNFDLHQVDPWIVRAVHEELREVMCWHSGMGNYSIRASDRLVEDLWIDPDDLADAARSIAFRAGYDFSEFEQNPLQGKVQTTGDLVMFLTHQRRLRPQHVFGRPRQATGH